MAGETEIESLVVKLGGDASEYEKMLAKAESDITSSVSIIEDLANEAIDAENKALAEAARITAAVAAPTENYARSVADLDRHLASGRISQESYNRALQQVSRTLPSVQQAEERARATQEAYNAAVRRAQSVIESVRTPLERYNLRLGDLNHLLDEDTLSTNTHARAVRALNKEYRDLRLDKIAAGFKSVGQGMTSTGRTLSFAVTAPIVAAGVMAERTFATYQQGLADLSAAANPTEAQLEKLRAASMRLSEELKIDPSLILGGFTELIKAGVSVEKVLDGTGAAAIQFAKIGKLDIAVASTIMADSMTVFGEEAQSTGDILSAAADSSSISIAQVAEAFSQVSAIAGSAGLTLKETAAAIALLGKNGVKGSDAGTSLKTMLIRLMAPVDKGAKVFKEFDLQVRDATGHMKPMAGIIAELESKFGNLGAAAKDQVLSDLFGSDAIRAGQIFLKAGASGLDEFTKSMDSANTVAQKFAISSETDIRAWEGMKASLSRLGIAIGATISQFLAPMLTWIEEHIKSATAWAQAHEGTVKTLLALAATAAALGPLLIVVGSLAGAISSLIVAFKLIKSLELITTQGSLATVALAGLALGLTAIAMKFYESSGAVKAFNEALQRTQQLANQLDARQAKQFADILSEAQKIDDPGQAKDFLASEIVRAKKEVEGYADGVKNAKKNIAELQAQQGLFGGAQDLLFDNKELALRNQELAEQEKRLQSNKSFVDQLEKAFTELDTTQQAAAGKEASGPVERAAKESTKLQTEVDKLTLKLKAQAATLGKTDEEMAIFQAQQKGATNEQLAGAKAAAATIKAFEDQKKQTDELTKSAQKYTSPGEKFKKTQTELKTLLDKGKISLETFNYELMQARDELSKDLKVNFKVSGIDAVEAGTAEALTRIEAFKRMTPGPITAQLGSSGSSLSGSSLRASPGAGTSASSAQMVAFLARIAANTSKIQKVDPKKMVNLEPANLGAGST